MFSAKSLAIMFGNGTVGTLKAATDSAAGAAIMKTEIFTYKKNGLTNTLPSDADTKSEHGWNPQYTAPDGKKYKKINPKFYKADTKGKDGTNITSETAATELVDGQKYFCSYDLLIEGSVIEVSANSFPGTLAA